MNKLKLKTISVLCLLLLGFIAVNAQTTVTNKGNFIIGGTLGFSTAASDVEGTVDGTNTNISTATATQLNIAPSIGYFLADNFTFGVGLDYTLNTIDNENENNSIDSDLLFGPFARYYLPVGDDMAFFIEADAGFGNSVDEITRDGDSQLINNSVFAVGVGPGFTIFSNNAFGIEALVKYNYARSDSDIDLNGISSTSTTLTNAIDFSVGFQVYFAGMQRAQ